MSLSTSDLSFMDLFLEKEDPLLHFDKDIIKHDEIKTVSLDDKHISDSDWQPDTDTFFNSILGLDEADKYPFTLLSDTETEFLTDGIFNSSASSTVESSSCSDSGLSSSDQQLSPILHDSEEVEEDRAGTESEGSDDAAVMPVVKEEVVELDESVYDIENNGDMHFDTLTYVYKPVDRSVIFERPATVSVHPLPPANTQLPQPPPHKVIRVPNPPSSRSLLIPINVKGTNGTVRTIRVIKPSMVQYKGATIVRQRRGSGSSGSGAESSSADDSATAHFAYPQLQLTLEEKRLMAKEGVTLPSHYPLTKIEERELKRIRRKIRNKISAQDSRKRKKEYVDSLEDRVKQCTEENLSLVKRVRTLQGANSQLSAQLRRLQQSLGTGGVQRNSPNSATAQPSTCLMVLILSLALVLAPNMRHSVRSATNTDLGSAELPDDNSATPFAGRSRTLLFSKTSEGVILESPLEKLDDPLVNAGDGGEESDDSGLISDMLTFWKGAPPVHVKDHDYTGVRERRGRKRERSFIVPPIDEEWQPAKRSLMEQLESKMAAVGAVAARSRNKTKMAGTKAVVINLASDGEGF